MKYKAFRVGPLPADPINRALALELEDGDVWVSSACHRHMAKDHSDDYPYIKANIIDLIREPTWVGQDPKHGRNFYLIRRIAVEEGAAAVLIAIGLEMTEYGTYSVRTAYRIKQEDIDNRILRGSTKRILPQ